MYIAAKKPVRKPVKKDIDAPIPPQVGTSRKYKVTLVVLITKPIVSTILYNPIA